MHQMKCKSNFANGLFRLGEESSATEVPTEKVQTPLAPPSSPNLSPSECFVTLHDVQELVKAVVDMQIPPGHTSKYARSHTPPDDPSEVTSTNLCSPTPSHMLPGLIGTNEHVQQFFGILKSLSTKQGPNSPDSVWVSEGANPDAPRR